MLICFFFSNNSLYFKESKAIFLSKVKELIKENKQHTISREVVDKIELIVSTVREFDEDTETRDFILSSLRNPDYPREPNVHEMIAEIEGFEFHETVNIEDLLMDTSPSLMEHVEVLQDDRMFDLNLDEERFVKMATHLASNKAIVEDKETRMSVNILIDALSVNKGEITEIADKSVTLPWDIQATIKLFEGVKLNKEKVLALLEEVEDVANVEMLVEVLEAYNVGLNQNDYLKICIGKWKNTDLQASFIEFILERNLIDFSKMQKKVKNFYDLPKPKDPSLPTHAFISFEFVSNLFEIASSGSYGKIKKILEWPVKQAPEFLGLTMVELSKMEQNYCYYETFLSVFPNFLNTNSTVGPAICEKLYESNKSLFLDLFIDLFEINKDIAFYSKMLDVILKIKNCLSEVVKSEKYDFAVMFGVLAVKRDFLHIDQWITERNESAGDPFISAIIRYLNKYIIEECKRPNHPSKETILEKSQLSQENLSFILNRLVALKYNDKTGVSTKTKNNIGKTYKEIYALFDDLQIQPKNSQQIEEETNKLYEKLFYDQISLEEFVNTVKAYKQSDQLHEREKYACLIHSLLDEYRFFNKYPERVLKIIGRLYGTLIREKLLEELVMSIAIKYIMEALKKQGGKMHSFALIALEEFAEHLDEFKNFVNDLINFKHIKDNNPELYAKIEKIFNKGNKPEEVEPKPVEQKNPTPLSMENKAKYGYSAQSEMKVGQRSFAASQSSADKDIFRKPKAAEPGPFPFNYKPEQHEPEQSKLKKDTRLKLINNPVKYNYSHLVTGEIKTTRPRLEVEEQVNKIFNQIVRSNIPEKAKELRRIIQSERIEEWFAFYFVMNRVINENNRLPSYNELISKMETKDLITLQCRFTVVSIKNIIEKENFGRETMQKTALKNLGTWLGMMTIGRNKPIINRQIDIKNLLIHSYEKNTSPIIIPFVCKILQESRNSLVFHNKNPWITLIISILIEFTQKGCKNNSKVEIEKIVKYLEIDSRDVRLTHYLDTVKPPVQPTVKETQLVDDKELIYKIVASCEEIIREMIAFLGSFKVECKEMQVAEMLSSALSVAINEILSPVVERAINISSVTTKELVMKDFYHEKNQDELKKYSLLCVKSLSGCLAIVTSKEPLKFSFINSLKAACVKLASEAEKSSDALNKMNFTEIIDIGIGYIEKSVNQRAKDKVEKDSLIEDIQTDRKNFFDLNNMMKSMEGFQAKIAAETEPNTLDKIYKDFRKIYGLSKEEKAKMQAMRDIFKIVTEFLENQSNKGDSMLVASRYTLVLTNLGFLGKSLELTSDSEVLDSLSKTVAKYTLDPDVLEPIIDTTINFLEKSFTRNNNNMTLIYAEMLRGFILKNETYKGYATSSVLSYPQPTFASSPYIHSILLRLGIFDLNVYNGAIIDMARDSFSTPYVSKILSVIKDSKYRMKANIAPMLAEGKLKDYQRFFSDSVKPHKRPDIRLINVDLAKIQSEDHLARFKELACSTFKEITFAYLSGDTDKVLKHIAKLNESTIVTDESQMNTFLLLIVEHSVDHCYSNYSCAPGTMQYDAIDRCAIFFGNILLNHINITNKKKLFENIMLSVFKLFHLDYIKNKDSFDQRPYFRLIFGLLTQLEEHPETQVLLVTAMELLKLMSPLHYPGFFNAWLDILSNKILLRNILTEELKPSTVVMHSKYASLVIDLLKFMTDFSEAEIKDFPSLTLLRDVTKYFYLLSKSYPHFFDYNYAILVAEIPSTKYIQLRNIILSTSKKEFPKSASIDEKIEMGKHVNNIAMFSVQDIIGKAGIRYNLTDARAAMDSILKGLLSLGEQEVLVHEALILSIMRENVQESAKIDQKDIVELFKHQIQGLNEEKRDIFINAMIDQLRYPSMGTFYFASLVIALIKDIKDLHIQEHFYKVIMQRLLFKPFPTGVMYVFRKLNKEEDFIRLIFRQKQTAGNLNKKMIAVVEKNIQRENLKNL